MLEWFIVELEITTQTNTMGRQCAVLSCGADINLESWKLYTVLLLLIARSDSRMS
jgi:hypothetical protein